MNAVAVVDNRSISERLHDEAQNAMDTLGDAEKAAKALDALIWRDQNLRDELIRTSTYRLCLALIATIRRRKRETAWHGNRNRDPSMASGASRTEALARGIAASLFDFPLPKGTLLRNATRAEILEASEVFTKQARDMGHKGRWLQLVAQLIPGDETAGAVLTEDRLLELQSEAADV